MADIITEPSPVMCELPWPTLVRIDEASELEPTRTPTPDILLLNIQLQPCYEQRLQASIHNTDTAVNTPLPPSRPPASPPPTPSPPVVKPVPPPDPDPPVAPVPCCSSRQTK